MKKLRPFILAALAAGTAQVATALNYNPADLLLVFRQDGQKDVEFDLGSVSNYLNQAVGTKVPITYNAALVRSTFNNSLSGVRFGVVATTGQLDPLPRVWVTDASVYSAPAYVTFSKFSLLSGKIESVGVNATIYTASNASPYVVATAASSGSSYDYLVTYGALASVSTMNGDMPTTVGGLSPLPADALNPATVALYEVRISTVNPKPAASLVGGFTLDAAGNLYFTAGALPPLVRTHIVATSADPENGLATVAFPTALGMNYQLYYATTLGGNWQAVPGAGLANGDGTSQSLSDFNAYDSSRFYRLVTTY